MFDGCAIFLRRIEHFSIRQKYSNTPSDAAIVLGASIWGDKPSPVFKARIDHAINLHQQGKVKYLVFTGAIGKGERFAEAKIAKNYALGQGVKLSLIHI